VSARAVILLAGVTFLPLAASGAGWSKPAPLDVALSACEHSVFKSSEKVGDDYSAYRHGLEQALRSEPRLREATQVWHSSAEPHVSATVGQWITRCDRWYAQAAKDELRFAILLCAKTHRTGTGAGDDLIRQAASTYRAARETAFSIDRSAATSVTDRIQGESYSGWLHRCDAWFQSRAPAGADLAEEMPTLSR